LRFSACLFSNHRPLVALTNKNIKERMSMDGEGSIQLPEFCGNRCGHNPATPRWFVPPEAHKPRPSFLTSLGKKIRDYYQNPAKILPSLNLANGKDRQQRSERREACLQLLACLIHYLDLVTLRVGTPSDGGFHGLTLLFLAGASGLGLRRAERACHDLKAAGILTVHPIAKRDAAGEYTGQPAIRSISQSLFKAFGMSVWLKHERDKATKRQREASRQEEPMGRLELALKAQEGRAKNPSDPAKAEPAAPQGHKNPTAHQHLQAALAMLRGQGPP
jgi:hypothetical protein